MTYTQTYVLILYCTVKLAELQRSFTFVTNCTQKKKKKAELILNAFMQYSCVRVCRCECVCVRVKLILTNNEDQKTMTMMPKLLLLS